MRLVIDTLIALMLVGILAGLLLQHRQKSNDVAQLKDVHESLRELQARTILHGALGETDVNELGFPTQVSPLWFGAQVPVNKLVPRNHPWIDFAPANDYNEHPPDPVITRPNQAGFWYNPARGIFRARVMPQVGDQQTLALYNQINGTTLRSLRRDADPERSPIPYVGDSPINTTQVASQALPDSGATVTINPQAVASPLHPTAATTTTTVEMTEPDKPVATDPFGRPIDMTNQSR